MAEISSASRVHKDEWTEDGVPFFRSSDVVAAYNGNQNEKAFISYSLYEALAAKSGKVQKGDLLITGGGSIAVPYIVPDDNPIYFKDADLIWLKLNERLNGLFLYFFFSSPNLRKHVSTISHVGTISHYTIEQVKATPSALPALPEQAAIGAFFRTLDDTIAIQKRKVDGLKKLKKAYLQQMFPRIGESIPRIRFAGFAEEWEQRRLGTFTKRVHGNDGRMDLPTLTMSASVGWMKQEDRFSSNIAGNEQKNYTLLRKGQLSYNHGNSKLAKYGVVFELMDHEEALVPRVYHSFTVINGNASFLNYYFATALPDQELGKLISSGARMDGLLNISYEDFSNITLLIPHLKEQTAIGNFFRSMDEQISTYQQKLNQLQQLKTAYLQNMFA